MRRRRWLFWANQAGLGGMAGVHFAMACGLLAALLLGRDVWAWSVWLWFPLIVLIGVGLLVFEVVPVRRDERSTDQSDDAGPDQSRGEGNGPRRLGLGVFGVVSACLFVVGIVKLNTRLQVVDYGSPALFGVLSVVGACGMGVTWWLGRRWFPKRRRRNPVRPRVRFRLRPFKISVALAVMLAASTAAGVGWSWWRVFSAEREIEYAQAMHGIYRAEQEYREGKRRLLEAVEVERIGADPEPLGETRRGLDVWRWPYVRLPGGFQKLATEAFVESYNRQMSHLVRAGAAGAEHRSFGESAER